MGEGRNAIPSHRRIDKQNVIPNEKLPGFFNVFTMSTPFLKVESVVALHTFNALPPLKPAFRHLNPAWYTIVLPS